MLMFLRSYETKCTPIPFTIGSGTTKTKDADGNLLKWMSEYSIEVLPIYYMNKEACRQSQISPSHVSKL